MNATQGRILPAIWKLLVLRVRISFNSFRRAKTGRKILLIITALMVLGFAGFMIYLSSLFLEFLRSPGLGSSVGIDAAPLLDALPVLILSGMFIGILVTSFGVLLQALYLSGDMDFLLSFPIPIRAVFVTKLMQAVLPNLGLIALFGLPILFGLGISGGYHFLYYPLLILMMIALALVAAGLSSLLVMLVARIVPARRAADVIGFLGALIAITCSQMGNFTNTMTGEADFSGEQFSGAASLLVRANTPWLPLNWAGRGLVDIGEGRWLSGTLLVLATLGLCAAGFWFTLGTAERWYYSGWAGMQVVAQKKKTVRTAQPPAKRESGLTSWTSRLLKAPVRAIIGKDFLVMRRDLRNLSQLISPLILGVLYTLMIFRSGGEPPPGQGEAPDLVHGHAQYPVVLFQRWHGTVGRLDAVVAPGKHRLFTGRQKFLDIESLPPARRRLAFCQVPGLLPARPGDGQRLPDRDLPRERGFHHGLSLQSAGSGTIPGRHERSDDCLRGGWSKFQLG